MKASIALHMENLSALVHTLNGCSRIVVSSVDTADAGITIVDVHFLQRWALATMTNMPLG